MSDWKKRAQISEDVVFFRYIPLKQIREAELVFIWDLDKTYLETHFESLKGLIRAALEKAFQKRNVAGTSSLVKALVSSQNKSGKPFPIFFITASPPQIEEKIRNKLDIDGIRPYGSIFKDNLQNLRPNRIWRLTHHMGYKLQALLELRLSLKEDVQQILWGDDSEADALVYSLYSDICARRLSENEMVRVLNGLHVETKQMQKIFELQAKVPNHDPVRKIYINLATDTDPEYYLKFGRRMVPTFDTFQAAIDLFQDGLLTQEQVVRISLDMSTNYAFTPDELAKSVEDLVKRKAVSAEKIKDLIDFMKTQRLIPQSFKFPENVTSFYDIEVEWVPQHIDYLFDYR